LLEAAVAGAPFVFGNTFLPAAASPPSAFAPAFFPLIVAITRLAVPHANEMTDCRILAAFFALSSEALRMIRSNAVSAAVLDVGLGDRDCTAVCQALLHHRIPFLFHTGQSNAAMLEAWPQAPVLAKPVCRDEIVAAVADLVY
jgi:hypothetical protein